MTHLPARHSAPFALVLLTTLILLAGCLGPTGATGVAVWVVDGGTDVLADTPPSSENTVFSASLGAIRLQAAQNETLGLQLVLRTTAPPAGPFDVQLSDLVGPRRTLPAAEVFSLYRAHYTRIESYRSWYPVHTGRAAVPTSFPDLLVPWDAPRGGGPLTLAEPRNEIVWIDVRVPLTIPPGVYRGRLIVRTQRTLTPVLACDVHLEVLPVALPDRRSLPVICRVDPRPLLETQLRWPHMDAEDVRLLPETPSHFAALRLVQSTIELLHAHRTMPILWASFPKLRSEGPRKVEVDWATYDALIADWLSGDAFPDHVPLESWPVPASLEHPEAARNGGLSSPGYARLLAAYLRDCHDHFAERGWLPRAHLRVCPPAPLTDAAVAAVNRIGRIVRQSETTLPLVAHLPPRSLRGLGWHDAPLIDTDGVAIWAPPATWFEPSAMQRERQLGRRAWLMPSEPPYSGSLAVEAPATDVRSLPWLAYRYDVDGLWIETAAEPEPTGPAPPALQPWLAAGLVHPAQRIAERDATLPTIRLKRLCRGLQDYELLRLLEDNGKRLLARRLAEQTIRWGATDACNENLLSCLPSGWPRDATPFQLARTLMLDELAGEFEPGPAARQRQFENLSRWGMLMSQRARVVAQVEGVRLRRSDPGFRALVACTAQNTTDRALHAHWTLSSAPADWLLAGSDPTRIEAGTRRAERLSIGLAGLAFNIDGVYPFQLALDTRELDAFALPARLAVAMCGIVSNAPRIDGALDDWPLATNNSAGDFQLAWESTDARSQDRRRPTAGTQAFFTTDHETLFVGVRCTLPPGEAPVWQADNNIPIDGAMPWGQDVVEVLIDPLGTAQTSSDLYCLQVKPSGLLLARRGCRTEPPIGASEAWPAGARVAVRVDHEAWVVELALPLAAFPPAARGNSVWGVNVTRLDSRRGEYSSWSGARAPCYRPATLGNLIMLWR